MNHTNHTAAQPLDLDKLEALAKEATPGPWERSLGQYDVIAPSETNAGKDYYHVCMPSGGDYDRMRANADFIAAASPDTILTLIAQARAAQQAAAVAAPSDEAILAARAEGRAEAVYILTGLCAESGIDEYTGWSTSGAPEDEGSAYWKEDKLRELFKCDDKLHNLFDRAESMYWQAKGEKEEAEREMRLVERAPFYKPLSDFLSKHQAWDLMGDLKREAAPTAVTAMTSEDARVKVLQAALSTLRDGTQLDAYNRNDDGLNDFMFRHGDMTKSDFKRWVWVIDAAMRATQQEGGK